METEAMRLEAGDSTRARVVALLRRGVATVDELAGRLAITPNAVRAQLAGLERDGIVEQRGTRPGVRKPSNLYALTPAMEQTLSKAYPPLLVALLDVLQARLAPEAVEDLLRDAGRRLAASGPLPGDLPARVAAASALLNELGGVTEVEERDGALVIRGCGCPVAAATRDHPAVCRGMEALLAHLIGAPVAECCDRGASPHCRFEVRPEVRMEAQAAQSSIT